MNAKEVDSLRGKLKFIFHEGKEFKSGGHTGEPNMAELARSCKMKRSTLRHFLNDTAPSNTRTLNCIEAFIVDYVKTHEHYFKPAPPKQEELPEPPKEGEEIICTGKIAVFLDQVKDKITALEDHLILHEKAFAKCADYGYVYKLERRIEALESVAGPNFPRKLHERVKALEAGQPRMTATEVQYRADRESHNLVLKNKTELLILMVENFSSIVNSTMFAAMTQVQFHSMKEMVELATTLREVYFDGTDRQGKAIGEVEKTATPTGAGNEAGP